MAADNPPAGGGSTGTTNRALVGTDGQRYVVTDQLVIGRRSDCGVVLDGDAVSRRHAQIRLDADGMLLVDLASSNGTFVDGTSITSARVTHGDVITIGAHELRVEESVSP